MSFLLQHAVVLAIAVPLFAAFATTLISKAGGRVRNAWAIIALLFTELLVVMLAADVFAGNTHVYTVGAIVPSLTSPEGFPIRIILVADAMSALVSCMAVTIALLAAVYSWKGIQEAQGVDKFYSLLLLLTAAMLGLSFTGDIFTMFVFLEISSIASAGLISFFSKGESFEAAFKYMILSATAGLFFLFGVGIFYAQYGALNIAAIASAVQANFSSLNAVAIALIAGALLLKGGSFPAHMWKPDAYQEAPAQVTSMLLAYGMVCLYALFRICFTIFGATAMHSALGWAIITLSALSIFVGVTMALVQSNLKRLMGYAAVAEAGYVMLGFGCALVAMPAASGFALRALYGGIFHLMNDAIDLSLLFLVVGAICFVTKKSDLNEIKGLAHSSKALALFFLIGTLAVAGMPPFNGFASKLLIFESVYYFNPLLSIIGILGSVIMLAIFIKVFASLFLGIPFKGKVSAVPKSMLAVFCVLAFFIILLGLFPQFVVELLIKPAASALVNSKAYIGGIL